MLNQYQAGRIIVPLTLKEADGNFISWRRIKIPEHKSKSHERELLNLCIYLKNPDLRAITIDDILCYLKDLLEIKKLHPNGIITRTTAIRRFFEYSRKRQWTSLDETLIPIPRPQFSIPRVIDEESYQKLINIIPQSLTDCRHIRNRAIVNLLWDTGARCGEICSLNVDSLDLKNKKAVIRTEKNRGSRPFREIFWTDETNKNIKLWLESRKKLTSKPFFSGTSSLFITLCGHKPGIRLRVHGVEEMLRVYCNAADIPYYNPHAYRHHKGHQIGQTTGSAIDAMNILGHASLKSVSPYVATRGAELEKRARMYM